MRDEDGPVLELRHDLVRALLGAVRDRELGGLLREQRPDDAARRAARAEHDDPAAGERLPLVDGDVANEADAVGVVADASGRRRC